MGEMVYSVNLAATLFMAGVIWFVQLVHYPLFARVDRAGFADYEIEHARRTGWVVAPVMLLELGTGALLLAVRPAGLPLGVAVAGFTLLGVIFLSTFLLQVPLHRSLSGGFLEITHRRLVRTNWLRTAAWTVRAGLLLASGLLLVL
jgi:hypothetical protein